MNGPALRAGPFMQSVAEHLLTSTGNSSPGAGPTAMDSRERPGRPGNRSRRPHQERRPGHHTSHPAQSRVRRDPSRDRSTCCRKFHARANPPMSVERQSASG